MNESKKPAVNEQVRNELDQLADEWIKDIYLNTDSSWETLYLMLRIKELIEIELDK